MTIANKLTYLAGTKSALRDAINEAGGNIGTPDTFRSYASGWLRDQSATLDLQFWCERFIARRRGNMTPSAVGFNNIVTFTRASAGGVNNEFGQYVQRAVNEWRNDHDPATLTTSTSTASFDSSTATFTLPTGHAFFVGDLFRATAVSGSLWGVVTARSDTSVTVYVRNTTGSGSSGSWTCIKPIGILIEEQRTNLLLRSSEFDNAVWQTNVGTCTVTPNSHVAPDGTLSADLLEFSGAVNANRFQSVAVTPGQPYTLSFWLRTPSGEGTKSFRIGSIATGGFLTVSVTENWQRFTVTQTPTAATRFPLIDSPTIGGRVIAWGAQLEAGSFATSYIPTEASQVTRAADVCSVNALSPWYNASEGVMSICGDSVWTGSGASYVAGFNGGSAANLLAIRRTAGLLGGIAINTSAVQATINSSYTSGDAFNSAFAFKLNDFAFCLNGGSVVSDNAGTMPTVDRISIGSLAGALQHNGHIKTLQYYPRRDIPIQDLTA